MSIFAEPARDLFYLYYCNLTINISTLKQNRNIKQIQRDSMKKIILLPTLAIGTLLFIANVQAATNNEIKPIVVRPLKKNINDKVILTNQTAEQKKVIINRDAQIVTSYTLAPQTQKVIRIKKCVISGFDFANHTMVVLHTSSEKSSALTIHNKDAVSHVLRITQGSNTTDRPFAPNESDSVEISPCLMKSIIFAADQAVHLELDSE